jgi:Ca2+-transporting ATPase
MERIAARADRGNPKEVCMQDRDAHGKPIEELVSGLQTHLERGLTLQEAQHRLQQFGANELTERPRPGFPALLWDQVNNTLVIILIVAALVSLALGEWVDSIAILFIVVLNAVVGVSQESKAEPALAPFFGTVPLSAGDWLVMLPFFFASAAAMELLKMYFRRRGPTDPAALASGGRAGFGGGRAV